VALDQARYAELFRSESQDQLSAINRALLTLESARESPAAVAEVFRAVHTVKGMSATMGYHAVAEFAHEFESRLDRIRGAGGRVTQPMMDALFAAADALEAGIAAASETAPRTEEMTASLSRLSGAFSAEALAAALEAGAAASAEAADGGAAPRGAPGAEAADPARAPIAEGATTRSTDRA
jgi:two-component system chemotaxis sensor kinase CheA